MACLWALPQGSGEALQHLKRRKQLLWVGVCSGFHEERGNLAPELRHFSPDGLCPDSATYQQNSPLSALPKGPGRILAVWNGHTHQQKFSANWKEGTWVLTDQDSGFSENYVWNYSISTILFATLNSLILANGGWWGWYVRYQNITTEECFKSDVAFDVLQVYMATRTRTPCRNPSRDMFQ